MEKYWPDQQLASRLPYPAAERQRENHNRLDRSRGLMTEQQPPQCPRCNGKHFKVAKIKKINLEVVMKCLDCGHKWTLPSRTKAAEWADRHRVE
jgi:transcription elongation factor Elf1